MIRLSRLGTYYDFEKCEPNETIRGLNYNSLLIEILSGLEYQEESSLPVSPSDGTTVILDSGPEIYYWLEDKNSWVQVIPDSRLVGFNKTENEFYSFDGSNWVLFTTPVDLSIKKDRSGLNILLNGSFEKDNYLADAWSVTGTGSVSWGDTTLLTNENLKCLDASLDNGDTLSTSTSTPNDCVGNVFEFSGWIGPRTEDVQVDLTFNLENGTTTIPASTNWEFFKILVEADDTTAFLEFRNADTVQFQIDELFFGPHKKIEAKEIAYNNSSSLLSSVDVQGAIDEIAARSEYIDKAVSSLEIDFLATTQFISISANTTFTFSNQFNGKTTILSIENTSGADVDVTFPSVVARSDISYTVEAGKYNVYTFFMSNNIIYLACVDGME